MDLAPSFMAETPLSLCSIAGDLQPMRHQWQYFDLILSSIPVQAGRMLVKNSAEFRHVYDEMRHLNYFC